MKSIVRFLVCFAIALATTLDHPTPARAAADVAQLSQLLLRVAQSPTAEAYLNVHGSLIDLVRVDDAPITKAQYDLLFQLHGKDALPELVFSGARTGISFTLPDGSTLIAYRKPGESTASEWLRQTPVVVGSLDRSAWRALMEEALRQGLSQYTKVSTAFGESAALEFRKSSPASFATRGGDVALSARFYDHMQLSPSHPPHGGASGFVVIVHEPHADFVGQEAMLHGLHTLKAANPLREFEYLVEGAYDRSNRAVEFNGLDTLIDTAGATDRGAAEAAVLDLLRPHVINGAMAYRLLYDRRGGVAFAIDSNAALQRAVRVPQTIDRETEIEALRRVSGAIAKSVANAPEEERVELEQLLFVSFAYATAEIDEIGSAQLVDFYETLSGLYLEVARIAGRAGLAASLAADEKVLRDQAAAYQAEKNVYKIALERDATLGRELVARCSGTHAPIQLAFIGSFHTEGVTRQLRAAGIGYVVVEPRVEGYVTPAQQAAFERMIHPATRAEAIRTALGTNTGQVAPSSAEVSGPISRFVKRSKTAAPPLLDPSTAPVTAGFVDVARATNAVHGNDFLVSAKVDAGGGGFRPPPPYGDAFAVFDPGDGQRGKRVILLKADDAGWQDAARYSFLQHVPLIPVERHGTVTRRTTVFRQDRASGRMFAVVPDRDSGAFYMMDATQALQLLDSLGPPAVTSGKETRVHIQLSDLVVNEEDAHG